MVRYDPQVAPVPSQWLALDEQERIDLAVAFHRSRKLNAPGLKAHAVLHVIVENQIAEALEPVQRALIRLMAEGLSRHDAIHAIGAVLAGHLHEVLNAKTKDSATVSQARYNAAVERLTASSWRRDLGV